MTTESIANWEWTSTGVASLACAAGRGTVCLERPDEGFRFEPGAAHRGADRSPGRRELLATVRPDGGPWKVADAYVRGADLIAIYEASDDREPGCLPEEATSNKAIRTIVYWRRISPADACSPAWQASEQAKTDFPCGVELIVSVQTHLLDADARMHVVSRLPGGDVRCPSDSSLKLWESASPIAARPGKRTGSMDVGRIAAEKMAERTAAAPQEVDSGGSACGCFLVRLADSDLDYLEMIHPADLRRSSARVAPSDDGANSEVGIDHALFRSGLEKGVILRSRIRGLWIPRGNDQACAADCYRQFIASEPPLTA
jgi:hypothetical protein